MSEVFYGLVDENNILIEYFKINEEDLDILNKLKEKFNAANAYSMDLSREIASIGETYWNGTRFVHPSPFPSWIFNEDINDWTAPLPYPEDGNTYLWNETAINWEEIQVSE
jgi:hypothetical protein